MDPSYLAERSRDFSSNRDPDPFLSWNSICPCVLVSTKNAKAQRILKSTEAIRLEKKRQLEGKYRTIHPFSDFRSVWEILMVISIYTITILESLILTFEQKAISKIPIEMINAKWIIFLFNFMLFIDIILNFCTGYYDRETKSVRLSFNDIAKKYLKKKFWIHVVFSIPWYLIAKTYEYHTGYTQQIHGDYDLRDYFAILSITRVLRFQDIEEFLAIYEQSSIKNKPFWKILVLVVYVTALYHFSACLLLNVFSLTEVNIYRANTNKTVESWIIRHNFFRKFKGSVIKKYIRCLFRATTSLLLYGDGMDVNKSDIDRNLTIVYRIIGVAHLLYLIGNMTLIVRLMYTDVRKHQTMTQYVTEMARHKRLPQRTIKKMLEYFKFKCDTKFFNETKLVGMLSTQLQKEVRFHCNKGSVEEVPMLKSLPKQILKQIIFCLNTDVFLPGDVLIKSGLTGDAMYFLVFGTVVVRLEGELDVEIRDSAYFGGMNLLSDDFIREEEVVAIEPCEVQVLKKEDFIRIMEPHPELLNKMIENGIKNDNSMNIFNKN